MTTLQILKKQKKLDAKNLSSEEKAKIEAIKTIDKISELSKKLKAPTQNSDS